LDDTPLVVVQVFGVRSRNLERVDCGDFIVAVIIEVVLTVMILISWFLDEALGSGSSALFLACNRWGGSDSIGKIEEVVGSIVCSMIRLWWRCREWIGCQFDEFIDRGALDVIAADLGGVLGGLDVLFGGGQVVEIVENWGLLLGSKCRWILGDLDGGVSRGLVCDRNSVSGSVRNGIGVSSREVGMG
jgi:hypothetical protein